MVNASTETAPSNSDDRSYRLLRESCGLVTTLPLKFLIIRGEDRKAWLQGQLTNDLRQLGPNGSIGACICAPTGQLLAACRVWSLDESYILGAHRDVMPKVAERFSASIIMEDVEFEVLEDFGLLSVQGPQATQWLSEKLDTPTLDAGKAVIGSHAIFVLRADHSGFGGWDIVYPSKALKGLKSALKDLEQVSDSALSLAQLEAGIPRFGSDMTEKTLPPEMGSQFESRMISYSKGCYTGQEVLMRIHSRGHTNRTWVALFTDDVVPIGSTISHSSRTDAGVITRAGDSPTFGPIAAAFLRPEAVADGEEVTVNTPNGPVLAEVRLMPLLRFD